jgi:predicted metal-dependent phosphoesterase TrpH
MPKFDHHLHTDRHSPDSVLSPRKLIARAKAAGLDGVVITEHDYQWGREEIAELAAQADGLKVFTGAEVSAREGHFLVYGLPDLEDVPAGVTLRELLKVVRGHKAAVVAAHPFRWDQPFDEIVAEHGPAFDALELVSNNVTAETRAKTARLLSERPTMGATGSSDGHEAEVVGCYSTEFTDGVATIRDFVAALKSRRFRPRHRPGAFLISGPVDERPRPSEAAGP